ncbi:MAG: hypothetical protein NVV59_19890 [Chitinophagaceae bacterium]|nr:hypothetical protein [Chitinophagaceae bacterium]
MKYILTVPFTYFFTSRVKKPSGLMFTAVNEWVISVGILYYFLGDLTTSIRDFAIGYISFITVYEIGYLFNDFYSIRYDANPRKRMGDKPISNLWFSVWVLARVLIAISIFIFLKWYNQPEIITVYAVLAIAFFLHNYLKSDQLKLMTFLNLATLRFFIPLVPFLNAAQLNLLLPAILVTHILYRFISYANSKSLVNIPDREKPSFRISFFALALLLGIAFWQMSGHPMPLFICGYYLVAWILFSYIFFKR